LFRHKAPLRLAGAVVKRSWQICRFYVIVVITKKVIFHCFGEDQIQIMRRIEMRYLKWIFMVSIVAMLSSAVVCWAEVIELKTGQKV
jgi:hypothetical protein